MLRSIDGHGRAGAASWETFSLPCVAVLRANKRRPWEAHLMFTYHYTWLVDYMRYMDV